MLKAPETSSQWLKLSFIVFGCVIVKLCLIISHISTEFLTKMLGSILLSDNNIASSSATNGQNTPIVSQVIPERRLYVLKILKSINSLDALQEEHVHYDLPFKKNCNSKGKNVSFSEPLTPNDEDSTFTSDDEDAIRFDEGSIKFTTPGFE